MNILLFLLLFFILIIVCINVIFCGYILHHLIIKNKVKENSGLLDRCFVIRDDYIDRNINSGFNKYRL